MISDFMQSAVLTVASFFCSHLSGGQVDQEAAAGGGAVDGEPAAGGAAGAGVDLPADGRGE